MPRIENPQPVAGFSSSFLWHDLAHECRFPKFVNTFQHPCTTRKTKGTGKSQLQTLVPLFELKFLGGGGSSLPLAVQELQIGGN